MNKKIIWFDIDDITMDFVWWILEHHNELNWTKFSKEMITDWEIHKIIWIDLSEFKKYAFESSAYFKTKINPEFLKVYNFYKNKWNKIIFISSRFDLEEYWVNTLKETEKWFKENWIEWKIILSDSKHIEIDKYKIDVFIDDRLHNIHWIYEFSKRKVDLILLNSPRNWEVEKARLKDKWIIIQEKKFKRINCISEVTKIIEKH